MHFEAEGADYCSDGSMNETVTKGLLLGIKLNERGFPLCVRIITTEVCVIMRAGFVFLRWQKSSPM